MQIRCPNCGARVTAENINIQNMTAVCAACHTVFPFEMPVAKDKTKWRDVRQPAKLILHDAETLRMEFATNFRLDKNGDFIVSLIGTPALALLGFSLLGNPGVPTIVPVVLLIAAVILFYWLALTVVNKTHIEMDDEAITVERKPFPNPLGQKLEIPLDGVAAIRYEETAISKKEAYDTPRYRVWAEMADGRRQTVVNDVVEDYAVYIAQALEERLYGGLEPDVTRLEDDGYDAGDDAYEILRKSKRDVRF